MNISILCVGKLKESYWRDAVAEYAKRLSKYCKLEIIEVEDEKNPDKSTAGTDKQCMEKEMERLKRYIRGNTYLISMAIEGRKTDSVGFANHISELQVRGESDITFVIGGSLGIASELKQQSRELISFSDMTFPHQVMRVLLLEQIYRAYRILNHEPYHK